MSDVTFSIRPASVDDLDALVQLEKDIQKTPWTREHLEAEMAKPFSVTWVLTDNETDSRVGAYLVYWGLENEAHLLTVGVPLEFRGLGFAKALVQKLISVSSSQGYRRVTLEVRKSNMPAISLYQSQGFNVTHMRKEFYPDGEDAYFMELLLTGEANSF